MINQEGSEMQVEGGCYCGKVRYKATGEPLLKAQCHCRECQYLTGGGPNFFMAMPADEFRYTGGEPRAFARADLESPVTREFCPDCGTHLVTRSPRRLRSAISAPPRFLNSSKSFSLRLYAT